MTYFYSEFYVIYGQPKQEDVRVLNHVVVIIIK